MTCWRYLLAGKKGIQHPFTPATQTQKAWGTPNTAQQKYGAAASFVWTPRLHAVVRVICIDCLPFLLAVGSPAEVDLALLSHQARPIHSQLGLPIGTKELQPPQPPPSIATSSIAKQSRRRHTAARAWCDGHPRPLSFARPSAPC